MSYRSNRVATIVRTHFQWAAVAAASLWLAGCGGGGGGGSDPTPPAAASLAVSGTAATSAPLANAAVDSKCATGSGSSNTAVDGSYTVTILSGALPCVVRVTAGSTVLHSVATGSGATARADITPVTELVVARLAGTLPANYYAGFDAAAAAALTPAAVQSAQTSVVDTLKAGGVDLSAAGDVITSPLAAGGAYATGLATLQTTLTTSGTSLATLTQATAQTSPAAPAASLSTVASLPADRLLAPAAASCASLRSGPYRIVVNENGGTAPSTEVVTINATALTVTNGAGQVFSAVSTGTCAFSVPSSGNELVVSRAGVITARVAGDNNTMVAAVLFPEQTHSVAELAGEWNTLEFDRTVDNGPIHLTSSTRTFDSAGKLTAINHCDNVLTCVALTGSNLPAVTLSANPAGGFNFVNAGDPNVDRTFAYRAGGGELMWVMIANAGHVSFSTRKAPLVLPTLARIQESWNVTATAAYTAPTAISVSRNTVASIDATAGSYVRNAVQNFTTGATRPETLVINNPREGYVHRLAATVTRSDGLTSNVSEFFALPLRGMDMSVVALPVANDLVLSVVSSTVVP